MSDTEDGNYERRVSSYIEQYQFHFLPFFLSLPSVWRPIEKTRQLTKADRKATYELTHYELNVYISFPCVVDQR